MTRQAFMNRLFAALRALPLISTALLLGVGLVASAHLTWLIWILGVSRWPEVASVERIHGLTWIALGLVAVVGLLTFALAFGRPDRISFGWNGATGEIDYPDAPTEPPQ